MLGGGTSQKLIRIHVHGDGDIHGEGELLQHPSQEPGEARAVRILGAVQSQSENLAPQFTYGSASFRACSGGFVGEAKGFAEQALGGAKLGLSYERAQDGCDCREQSFSFSPDQEAKHADGNEAVLKGGVASGGFIHQDKVRVQFQSQREGLGFAGVQALVPAERSGDAAGRPGLE